MATNVRLARMEEEMGYIGTGIFWRAMELINSMDGSYPLKGLLNTFKNRHAKQGKVMQVLMNYGLFEVDSSGLVRFCEAPKQTLAEPSNSPVELIPPSKTHPARTANVRTMEDGHCRPYAQKGYERGGYQGVSDGGNRAYSHEFFYGLQSSRTLIIL